MTSEPTVPESAPRVGMCMTCGSFGGTSETCADLFHAQFSAPRPVPETAATCECGDPRDQHFEYELACLQCDPCLRYSPSPEPAHAHEWVILDSPALRCACGALTLPDGEPPAPPAEPVEEAQRVDFMTTPANDAAYDAMLNAELMRCADCGGTKGDEMHLAQAQGDIDGTTHAFTPPMEVEDEGARPLTYMTRGGHGTGEAWQTVYNGEIWLPEDLLAAIRKEATAALTDDAAIWAEADRRYELPREGGTYAGNERLRQRWAFVNGAKYARTRADAAEGALRELRAQAQVVIDSFEEARTAMIVYLETPGDSGRDAENWESLKRALTAESVTPTGESK